MAAARPPVEPCTLPQKGNAALTRKNPDRPDVWDAALQQERVMWTADEVDVSMDDLSCVTPAEAQMVQVVLAFFATGDNIIMQNIAEFFGNEITYPDVRYYYGFQTAAEGVHAATYAALLEKYVPNAEKRHNLIEGCGSERVYGAATRKAQWATKWMSADIPLATRVVAFTFVEGLLFASAFTLFFWLRQRYRGRDVLPGLLRSNAFIQRDENIHAQFHGRTLYALMKHKPKADTVRAIARDAVATEDAFLEAIYHDNADLALSRADIMQYVQYQADTILEWLGVPRMYMVSNPFPWMAEMALSRVTNMFESHATAYNRVRGSVQCLEDNSDDEDF